ncbi:hypothetical protein Dda_9437 [Drechslerella dactyloides]|uniref:Uncharacterized protein n=1 Tax=Drechslerella dactyloides TaxID=74499 RepID=A0AAD6IPH7_DREDA|nr:hypothetical protein Dda_9437 [Drechslerella dactyloides]
MMGLSLIFNTRHQPWIRLLPGILLLSHAASAAPLNVGGRGSWQNPIERREEVEGQLYDGSSMRYATLLPTPPQDQPTTTTPIVILVPSTTAAAIPVITTPSDETSTSSYAAPTSTSSAPETLTSTESTELLPGGTDVSSSTSPSTSSSFSSASSSTSTESSSSSSTIIGMPSASSYVSTSQTSIPSSEAITSESTTSSASTPAAFETTSNSETITSTSTVVLDTTTSYGSSSTLATSETNPPAYDTRTFVSETSATQTATSSSESQTTSAFSSSSSSSSSYETPISNPFDVPGFVTIPVPSTLARTTTSLAITTTSDGSSDTSSSTATVSTAVETSIAPVPTGTPAFGPGFSFIRRPGAGGDSSSSIEVTSSPAQGAASTSSLGFGNTASVATTSQAYNTPSETTSTLETSTIELPTSSVVSSASTSSSLIAFPTTTSEPATPSSTTVTETFASSSESSSPVSEVIDTSSTSADAISTATEIVTTVPAIPVATGGIPDLILPSSAPEGYAPYPTDGTTVTTSSSAEIEPITTTSNDVFPTTNGNLLPTEASPEPTSDVMTGTPGAPPDLVLPSTTSDAFVTDTLGGGGDYQTTAVSPSSSSLETTQSSSSTLQEMTSSSLAAPTPTTVFVTVVVPTAPTTTVTQTVYPSSSPSAPETLESTETAAPTNDYNTAIPTGTVGSPPDLIIPSSQAESVAPTFETETPESSTTTTTATNIASTPIPSSILTSVRSRTTILQTVTVTSTKNVVYTSYRTVIATNPSAILEPLRPTSPETIPVPTGSDILTTVFETQTATAILTAIPSPDSNSRVPEFGNIISVTLSVSYPAPLFPIPGGLDSTAIRTTIQLSSTFQRVGISTPVPSAPFTYIGSTIPYPYPTLSPDADTSPTSVAVSSQPVRTGFVIPGPIIISRQDFSASQAASTYDISNSGAAAPTTLATSTVTSNGGTPSVKPRSTYAPVAVGNVKRAPLQILEVRSSAPQLRAALGPAAFVFITVALLISLVA